MECPRLGTKLVHAGGQDLEAVQVGVELGAPAPPSAARRRAAPPARSSAVGAGVVRGRRTARTGTSPPCPRRPSRASATATRPRGRARRTRTQPTNVPMVPAAAVNAISHRYHGAGVASTSRRKASSASSAAVTSALRVAMRSTGPRRPGQGQAQHHQVRRGDRADQRHPPGCATASGAPSMPSTPAAGNRRTTAPAPPGR